MLLLAWQGIQSGLSAHVGYIILILSHISFLRLLLARATLVIYIRVGVCTGVSIYHFTFGGASIIIMILRWVQICVVICRLEHRIFQIQIWSILNNILNNVFFNYLCFISVMSRILLILNLNWTFLLTSGTRSWSQKLLRGVISDDNVFLNSSIGSFSIFRNFRMF